MGRLRVPDRGAGAVADENDAPTLLRNPILLCPHDLIFDIISERAQFLFNGMHGFATGNREDAGDVLHDDPLGIQSFDDTKILSEELRSLIVHTALMIVDRVGLTWRAADEDGQFSFLQPDFFEQAIEIEILNGLTEELRVWVCCLERLPGRREEVVASKDLKASHL
jgi:hypothetical protein